MTAANQPLALIVFAYNEAENVPVVLPAIRDWLRSRGAEYELVFVDDGSTDATHEAARRVFGDDASCRIVVHDRNRGIGAAIKSGVRASRLPWVSFLPCDGQIPVEEIGLLCEAAEHEAVRVVFSVYEHRNDGLHRKVLSLGVRSLIRGVHAVTMRSDGPYLFRRELFDADVLVPDTFFLNFEFPIRIYRSGERYATVMIRCVPRVAGRSKSTGLKRIVGVARDLWDLRRRMRSERSGARRAATRDQM